MRPMRNTRLGTPLFALPIIAILIGLGGCHKEAASPPPQTVQTTPPSAPPAPKPKVRPWVVLCAYQPIAQELSTLAQVQDDTIWAGRPISVGWIVKPVVIAASGVGMANAAATTQFLIDRYNPVGIILAGVATPLDPAHEIGDLIIPDRWLSYDFGYWGKDGFKLDSVPVGKTDGSGFNRMLEIQADAALIRMLNTAADATAFTLRT
ncbi:MAG: hypothetical protein HY304_05900, partial [candidate division Zixibacteria bacterium]|nr:hypothetical protein [candidate division Zixibacteria bacterium]